MRIYLTDKQALAYFQQQASPDFWDSHWRIEDLQSYLRGYKSDNLFIPLVKRYLPAGKIILEGGCGRGQLVYALQYQGYQAIGIDYAARTVQKIIEAVPELDIRLGDVRNLAIAENSLDGYVSTGVIEHFWDGYHEIISEMHRTLRPGGFLFISFPFMSFLRRWKNRFGLYQKADSDSLAEMQGEFYQFALTTNHVIADLQSLGFILLEKLSYSGIKGFKDEVTWMRPWLQDVYDGKRGRHIRHHLDHLFKPFASHSALLVMQKKSA